MNPQPQSQPQPQASPEAPSRHGAGRTPWWKLLIKYGVPLAITVGLCWLLFTGVDIHEVVRIIRTQCDFRWIAAGLALNVLAQAARAVRWRIQLSALGVKPPVWILVFTIFGTYAVNLILPRLGELWRTGYIAARQKAPFSTVFGSMICDRLSDTLTVLLLFLLALGLALPQIMSFLGQNPDLGRKIHAVLTSPWTWSAIPALILIIWLICKWYPDNRAVREIKSLCLGIWRGFAIIGQMKGKGEWLVYTGVIWASYFLGLYCSFFAFPATAKVVADYGSVAVLVCFVFSSLSMAVPSNGGIGPYQWALMFGLGMYSAGIPELTKEYATSFANLVMGTQTLLLIVLGIITFIVLSIDKRRHDRAAAEPAQSPSTPSK